MSAQCNSALNATRAVDIHFKNVSYEVQLGYRGPKKQILKSLNGIFKCGELTAIMGPSGAGKSSLLNTLTGFIGSKENGLRGTVEYVSRQGKLDRNKHKKLSCYIQQTDSLYNLLTVQESMILAFYLKIADMQHNVRLMLIDDILNILSLANAKNTKVERLSGGQKKRLSIALELIDNPPIMFLDEPTTGLDSLSSLQCITALQTLAKSGRAIICTIHQPSAALFHIFDYVYLVVDGQCMYAGMPDNTVTYFAKQGLQCPQYHNPADYMLEVVSQEYGNYSDQLIVAASNHCHRDNSPLKKFLKAQLSFASDREDNPISPPSEMTRFRLLLRRNILLQYRDSAKINIKIIVHFLVGILLGLLFEHAGEYANKSISNIGYLLVTIIYLSCTSMMPSVLYFPLEINILRKERFNNWYQLKTYYITMILMSIPLQISIGFVYSAISYVLSSQPIEWFRYYRFLIIVILTNINSESLGVNLGTFFNPINGTFFSSIILCMLLLLTGFLIFFSHMPLVFYYLSYANFLKYAFEGLLQAVYGYERDKLTCPSSEIYCHLRAPSKILEELSLTKSVFWIDVVVLLIHFVILRTIGYLMLKKKLAKL